MQIIRALAKKGQCLLNVNGTQEKSEAISLKVHPQTAFLFKRICGRLRVTQGHALSILLDIAEGKTSAPRRNYSLHR